MRAVRPVSLLAAVLMPSIVLAEPSGNVLTLGTIDRAANLAAVEIAGSHNTLAITQSVLSSPGSGNVVAVSLTGDRNGGGRPGTLTPAPLIAGLPWGSLSQAGEANRMEVSVAGSDNLFALAQTGASNTLLASIVGDGNRSAVSQTGANNAAVFSQAGAGNMVSITQRSW